MCAGELRRGRSRAGHMFESPGLGGRALAHWGAATACPWSAVPALQMAPEPGSGEQTPGAGGALPLTRPGKGLRVGRVRMGIGWVQWD